MYLDGQRKPLYRCRYIYNRRPFFHDPRAMSGLRGNPVARRPRRDVSRPFDRAQAARLRPCRYGGLFRVHRPARMAGLWDLCGRSRVRRDAGSRQLCPVGGRGPDPGTSRRDHLGAWRQWVGVQRAERRLGISTLPPRPVGCPIPLATAAMPSAPPPSFADPLKEISSCPTQS
jgi:hypothetical protein